MDRLRIDPGGWVVVCDGARALVFENVGDEKFPNLKAREVRDLGDDPKTHELGTDKPGRSINSVGNARSAMEQTDWHEQAEETFLTNLSDRLAKAVHNGDAKSLVIVAPPKALGVLRAHYTPALKKAIQTEVQKDYVKLPVHEIEKHLVG